MAKRSIESPPHDCEGTLPALQSCDNHRWFAADRESEGGVFRSDWVKLFWVFPKTFPTVKWGHCLFVVPGFFGTFRWSTLMEFWPPHFEPCGYMSTVWTCRHLVELKSGPPDEFALLSNARALSSLHHAPRQRCGSLPVVGFQSRSLMRRTMIRRATIGRSSPTAIIGCPHMTEPRWRLKSD